MKQYVGLDVSQDQTSICVVDESGHVLWQGKCATTPEAIAATLRTRAPQGDRIGLESGPLSIWLCHELTALGLPVVCLDARHAQAALSLQLNKSDANDARGLAQIVRTGWYREVVVKGLDGQRMRALITARPAGRPAGRSRQPNPGPSQAVWPAGRQGSRQDLRREGPQPSPRRSAARGRRSPAEGLGSGQQGSRHAEPAPGRRSSPGRDGAPADDRARRRRAGGADLCQHDR
jgi:hypothetical protein